MEVAKNKSIKEQAREEILAELNQEAVESLKEKLKELHAAKKIVANLEREIEDLEEELAQEAEDINS